MKCALEMLLATEEKRATAVERLKREEELRLAKLKAENEVFYNMIIATCLDKFEEKFSDFTGDPKEFKCEIILKNFTNGNGNIYPISLRSVSRYADHREDFDINCSHRLNIEVLHKEFEKLCYKMELKHYSYDWECFYSYGLGYCAFLKIFLSIDPKCFE